MIRVSGVFKVVALRGSAGHHRVDVQHPPDQTVQLIQLVELQVRHLLCVCVVVVVGEERENMDYITEGMWSGKHREETGWGGTAGGKKTGTFITVCFNWFTVLNNYLSFFPIFNLRAPFCFALFLSLDIFEETFLTPRPADYRRQK